MTPRRAGGQPGAGQVPAACRRTRPQPHRILVSLGVRRSGSACFNRQGHGLTVLSTKSANLLETTSLKAADKSPSARLSTSPHDSGTFARTCLRTSSQNNSHPPGVARGKPHSACREQAPSPAVETEYHRVSRIQWSSSDVPIGYRNLSAGKATLPLDKSAALCIAERFERVGRIWIVGA